MTHQTIEAEVDTRYGEGLGLVRTGTTQVFGVDDPLRLQSGLVLGPVEVAFETYGQINSDSSNVVVICHALTGDAHAAGHHGNPSRRGWWDNLIGPGKPIDTDRFFVVSSNILGGCKGTTGPSSINPASDRHYGLDFPVFTVADIVKVQRALLRKLGVSRVHAVVGGSLGGMQALEWALQDPDGVRSALVICASAALGAQNIALSAVARQAILRDPDFKSGGYLEQGLRPATGLSVARMLGHITYLSDAALAEKFGRQRSDESMPKTGHDWFRSRFEIERYLDHQAESFLERFDPLSYLYLTRVMDEFEPFGQPDASTRLAKAAAASTKFQIESFSSDWRFGPDHSEFIAGQLAAAGCQVQSTLIESPWGHDSFLLPLPQHLSLIERALS